MNLNGILYIIYLATLSLIACNDEPKAKIQFINTAIDSTTTTNNIFYSDLIDTFKSLDGKTIQTEGIAYFEFENVSICLDKEYDSNCFWIDLNRNLLINDSLPQKASGQRFVIKSTIDISSKSHLGAYLATI